MIPDLLKYLQYVENTSGNVDIAGFDDDWEPIGPMVRREILPMYVIAFAAACDAAGLTGVTPHVLRHSVATWLDEDGIPIERISKLLGHRDTRTTQRIYAKPGVQVLRPAADVIDLRLRGKKAAK